MWTIDDWMIEVRLHLDDHEIDLVEGDFSTMEYLFDQGFTPSEALLFFLEN